MADFSHDHVRAWCVRWQYRSIIYVDFEEMRSALAEVGFDVQELLANGGIWRGYGLIDRCDCWYNDYYRLIRDH
jgi:hypothetical protein